MTEQGNGNMEAYILWDFKKQSPNKHKKYLRWRKTGRNEREEQKSKKRYIGKEDDYLLAFFPPSPFSVSSYMDKLTVFLYLYRMRLYENKTNLPNNRR